jgi:methyl-accepting chemotaxis protein
VRTDAADLETQLSSRRGAFLEGLLYPSDVAAGWDGLDGAFRGVWRARLQSVLGGGSPGAAAGAAAPIQPDLAPFLQATTEVRADLQSLLTAMTDSTQGVARPLISLLTIFAALGAIVALIFVLGSLRLLRRDLSRVVAEGGGPGASDAPGQATGFAEAALRRDDEIGRIARRLRVRAAQESIVASLRSALEKVTADADVIGAELERVAAAVQTQAGAVETASRAQAGFPATTREIEENARAGMDAARAGGSAVERSLEKIARGVQTAHAVEERATQIEEAVALIGDVADQTELVALNAAIEAARAGESGRGFTTVAQQVRKLADRSARAAAEMGDLVEAVMDGVRRMGADARESLDAGGALRKDLQRITGGINSIAALTRSAGKGVEKAGSSLAGAQEISADAAKSLKNLVSAYAGIRAVMEDISKQVRRLAGLDGD